MNHLRGRRPQRRAFSAQAWTTTTHAAAAGIQVRGRGRRGGAVRRGRACARPATCPRAHDVHALAGPAPGCGE
eukprot:scaffold910_cov396-Prasinococcus_capsulatus_cf.AAC.53